MSTSTHKDELVRYNWWCPYDAFEIVFLEKTGWKEASRVHIDGTIWVRMTKVTVEGQHEGFARQQVHR